MTVRLCKETDLSAWDQYVQRAAGASCYHLSGWKQIVEGSFGHRTSYLLAEKEEVIQGILPLVHLKSILFGNFLVSMPYFNYGGICADDSTAAVELLRAAEAIADDVGAAHIELRQGEKAGFVLPSKTAKASMRLSLPGEAAELWKSLPAKLRSQVQRPRKGGCRAVVGRENELDGFYDVFSENMRDLGTPVYPKSFFRRILERFPDQTWILTIRGPEGKALASGFLVGFRQTLEIPWASSLRRFNRLSPNMLLYWSALEFACEKGYQTFDFGRSSPDSGTYRFKEQWGATPTILHWYYWMKNAGPLPELNPLNPKYRLAISLWKRMPMSLTRLIGPHIVKNLP